MATDWLRRYTPRKLLVLLILGVAYYATGRLGLALAIGNSSISVVWPPTGIAIAAVVLEGFEVWPAITIGAFLVNMAITGDVLTSLPIAIGNTLEGVVGGYLVLRFAGGPEAANRPTDVLRFALLGALTAALIAATVGVTTLTVAGRSPLSLYGHAWFTWWLGDAVGALEFAPLLLAVAWWWGHRSLTRAWKDAPEAAALGVVTLGLAGLVFGRTSDALLSDIPVVFILLPPVVWAAFRFGPLGASLAVTSTSLIAIVGTVLGSGPFAALSRADALDALRVFVGSLALTGFLVAAEAVQRGRAEEGLTRSGLELERKVQERTALLESAQALAHIGSWELDLVSDVVRWSPEMYRIYGRSSDAPLSLTSALEGVDPEGLQDIQGTLRGLLRAPDPLHTQLAPRQFRIHRPDGEVRTLEGRARVAEMRDGRPSLLVGTVQDITERTAMVRELEQRGAELTRSNAELEQFAYVASHDLQEPLGVVEGYTQLLSDRYRGKLDADADTFLGFANEAAIRMRRLINDLLEYSRTSRAPAPATSVESRAALDEALANLVPAIAAAAAHVRVVDPLPAVYVEHTELVRLFQNLVSNAVKFRTTTAPEIEIGVQRAGPDYLFRVRDNGIGIAPEHLERIFAIFQRLHTQVEHPGTGMGLAISRRIVEHHGGRIWAESHGVPGQGSTFWFSLPEGPPAGPG
jgi:PAS domain S-box-containing protein